MKLKFKNFRCYTDKEFDFGSDGLVLLSGPSGVGKSTIFQGIVFALYDKGQKPQTFGQRSCRVELEVDNLRIVRQRCPNLFLVTDTLTDEEYQGDAGQGIINEKFGTNFEITSYIQQNAKKSFFAMSPTDKITFLEKFAFEGVELDKIKGRCNGEANRASKTLTQVSSQLSFASENFQSVVKPEKVAFPLKGIDKEKAIKNESVRLQNAKTRIAKAERTIEKLSRELTDAKVAEVERKNREEKISALREKIRVLESEKKSVIYQGDKSLSKYEEQLSYVLSHKELSSLKKQYTQDKSRLEQMEKSEKEQTNAELSRISSQLWKGATREEAEQTVEEYEKLTEDLEAIQNLKKYASTLRIDRKKIADDSIRLEKNRELLLELQEKLPKLRLQDELYECPACSTRLRFQDSVLHLFEEELPEAEENADEVARKITSISKSISTLERFLSEERAKAQKLEETEKEISRLSSQYEDLIPLDEAETTLEETRRYLSTNLELEKNKRKLEGIKGFSPPLLSFRKQLQALEGEIRKLEEKGVYEGVEKGEDESRKRFTELFGTKSATASILREIIAEQKLAKQFLTQIEKQLGTYRGELSTMEEEDENTLQSPENLSENLSRELSKEKEALLTYRQDLETSTANMVAVGKYSEYVEKATEYKKRAKQIAELTESEVKAKNELTAISMLKEKIQQAENLALANFINSINSHAQEYLELFFPTDPISVRLLPFKETKKSVKPQISTAIDYKGMEADVDMLSGGELARVILAFTLALAELFNAPLLILDECTASLDQEATSVVMEGLRSHFTNRLTVVIAHQVVAGNFDRELTLN